MHHALRLVRVAEYVMVRGPGKYILACRLAWIGNHKRCVR